ncbi:MAG: lipopolysaccharide kinase InaA family protein [Methylotenera sp.]
MTFNLQSLSHIGQQAFEISLRDSFSLQVEAIVRCVPNKRLVCRGVWNKQPVYAKLFIGNNAKRYAQRDKQGVEFLVKAHIATPDLLFAGTTDDSATEVLIYQAIENSENAEVAYVREPNQAARFALATKIVREVAKHHNANLLQTDLYLKNFLIKNGLVYTLDGDGVRQHSKLSERQALKNFSVLLSKFDVVEIENWLSYLVKTYVEIRAWQATPDLTTIKNLVNQHRKKVANDYADKKVFRQCTDVQIHQHNNYFVAISTQFALKSLPKNSKDCDALIASQQCIKNGNTCTVALAQIDAMGVVIKRYNIKSVWHGVNRSLRQTRAAVSWANAHRLKLLDIATAAPIALIEERRFGSSNFGLRGKAYFLSEYINAPDVAEFFAETSDKALQMDTVRNIVALFYRLYLLQISHGDMKASNIKIVDKKPLLIDLDSMQQHQIDWLALRAHVRDLHRFMQNWQEMPALYNAFVKAFKMVYTDHRPLHLAHIIQ